MKQIADEIRAVVHAAAERLASMSDEEACHQDGPGEWSKKEILGHLIDSASNNHQRFVRACSSGALDFPYYNQVEWAQVQHCQEADWGNLVTLWLAFNRHLCHIIEHIPESAYSHPCNIGRPEPVALEFVVSDYLRHMKHHLVDLLAEPG
jgi:hypothetical protein